MKLKKFLAVILSMMILLSVLPLGGIGTLTSLADTSGYYIYTVTDGEAIISAVYTAPSGNITIPSTLGGYPVTRIGESAFKNCTNLTSIIIPDSVTIIYGSAFEYCTTLTSITIPDSVTTIGEGAFKNCTSLASITIPDSVTTIGGRAFYNTAYHNNSSNWENSVLYIGKHLIVADDLISGSYTIKSGTLTIADDAFDYCYNLTSVTIPDSVTSIGMYAFYRCQSLTNITIGNGITYVGYNPFYDCKNLTTVNINDIAAWCNIYFDSGDNIIYNAKKLYLNGELVTDLIIPDGVTSIGWTAFYNCKSFTSVTIPVSVTSIDDWAFRDCTNIKTVYYLGTKEQWNNISIGSYNSCLTNANINCVCEHVYSNACDNKCNLCSETRTVPAHKYKTISKSATEKANGKIDTKCTVCGKISSSKTIKKISSVTLSTKEYTYNGKVKSPTVTVKDSSGKKLVKNTDYTVTYASGRKNVGKYKVTIKFKGNYSGTKTLYFTINPVKTTVKKLTAGKKSIKVAITKKSAQVTGYQIQYATNKSFKSAKTKTVSSYKTTSTTLSKLSAKKTYYVRVRTYKTVNGKKYYSGWSSYKSVKTK